MTFIDDLQELDEDFLLAYNDTTAKLERRQDEWRIHELFVMAEKDSSWSFDYTIRDHHAQTSVVVNRGTYLAKQEAINEIRRAITDGFPS